MATSSVSVGGRPLPLFGAEHSLGQRIKCVRLFYELTQRDFAESLGVSRSYLSEVENDKGKATIEMLVGISDAYPAINPRWLLNGTGEFLVGSRSHSIIAVPSRHAGRPRSDRKSK